jgi:hypothetical protein
MSMSHQVGVCEIAAKSTFASASIATTATADEGRLSGKHGTDIYRRPAAELLNPCISQAMHSTPAQGKAGRT